MSDHLNICILTHADTRSGVKDKPVVTTDTTGALVCFDPHGANEIAQQSTRVHLKRMSLVTCFHRTRQRDLFVWRNVPQTTAFVLFLSQTRFLSKTFLTSCHRSAKEPPSQRRTHTRLWITRHLCYKSLDLFKVHLCFYPHTVNLGIWVWLKVLFPFYTFIPTNLKLAPFWPKKYWQGLFFVANTTRVLYLN